MRTYTKTLTAGRSETLTVNGNYFALLSAAGPIDLDFQYVGQSGSTDISTGIEQGYSETFPGQLTAVVVTSATAQDIRYGCGNGVARFDRSQIISAQVDSTNNIAPVTVGLTAALALAGSSTRRRLILTAGRSNSGAIALGGPALTVANAARWLDPGDSYIETDAAPAAVYALGEVAGDKLCIEVA